MCVIVIPFPTCFVAHYCKQNHRDLIKLIMFVSTGNLNSFLFKLTFFLPAPLPPVTTAQNQCLQRQAYGDDSLCGTTAS